MTSIPLFPTLNSTNASAGPSTTSNDSPVIATAEASASSGDNAARAGSEEDTGKDEVRGVKRTRRFHHRSRNGCEHCKKRRVRCDEGKPVCGNCIKKGTRELCVYHIPAEGWSNSEGHHHSSTNPAPPLPAPVPPVYVDPQNIAGPSQPYGVRMADIQPQAGPLPNPALFPYLGAGMSFGLNPSRFPSGASLDTTINSQLFPGPSFDTFGLPGDASNGVSNDSSDIIEIPRQDPPVPLSSPAPLTPNTTNMLNLLFGEPKTPPLPSLTWTSNGLPQEEDTGQESNDANAQSALDWGFGVGLASASSGTQQALSWDTSGRTFISDAILRQTHILQQPNELAIYFPTLEQRRQFSHFLYETSNDLLVVPTAHATNPWILHLSHLALGKAAGHEVLHDAFRSGLLSLASFDIGLKMRKNSQSPGYVSMYQTSMEHRDTALRLLRVAKVLKLYEYHAADTHADLVLATVTALAIRDRLAGTQDFEEPLDLGVNAIVDQGGPVAFISRHPTPGRRFLVEQMATLELLGVMTTWKAPRVLVGDTSWFTHGNLLGQDDHLTEVYGWDRLTIAFTAESMVLAEDIKEVWILRAALRRHSYSCLQKALSTRVAQLNIRHKAMVHRAAAVRLETIIAPIHPRAAINASLQQACMELLLINEWQEEENFQDVLAPKCKAILDLCEQAMDQGMYAGLMLPLTWAAFCLDSEDRARLRKLFRRLQPHYHVDPGVMQQVSEVDWDVLATSDPADWCETQKQHGFFMTFF